MAGAGAGAKAGAGAGAGAGGVAGTLPYTVDVTLMGANEPVRL